MSAPATEREKYLGIYEPTATHYQRYGHSNHGRQAMPLLAEGAPSSVVDIGCGWNEFARGVREALPAVSVTGVDFACPGADVNADATHLPFARKSFDVLTAFDMLEHLLPEQVDAALAEFARVSRRFIFSISYVDSVYRWRGATLHPTVRAESWWMDRIKAAGGAPTRRGRYICGAWAVRPTEPNERVILVGNGPAVLQGNLGALVDAHDQVVRFNAFAIRGFEAHVGTRTDLWSTFGRGTLPADDDERPQRVIYTHGENAKIPYPAAEVYGIPRPFHDDLRRQLQDRTTKTGEKRERLLPTSGLTVAMWLLRMHRLKHLTLHGFDHFSKVASSQHHYWVPKAYGQPAEHDGVLESSIFGELVTEGAVSYLSLPPHSACTTSSSATQG